MVSFRNAVTDVHRRKFGRGNPRAWLRAFGELGRRLFELYCLARVRRKEVLETVNTEFSALSEFSVKNRAAELLNEMDQRGECVGKSQQESSLHDEHHVSMYVKYLSKNDNIRYCVRTYSCALMKTQIHENCRAVCLQGMGHHRATTGE